MQQRIQSRRRPYLQTLGDYRVDTRLYALALILIIFLCIPAYIQASMNIAAYPRTYLLETSFTLLTATFLTNHFLHNRHGPRRGRQQ